MQHPDRKVGIGAGAIGVPTGIVIAWILTTFVGVDVPETVATAFGGIVSFAAAYLLPDR